MNEQIDDFISGDSIHFFIHMEEEDDDNKDVKKLVVIPTETDTKNLDNSPTWDEIRKRYDDIDLYRQRPTTPGTWRPDQVYRALKEIWGDPNKSNGSEKKQ